MHESVGVCRVSVVVARRGVLATRYFKLVAYAVAVRVISEAVASRSRNRLSAYVHEPSVVCRVCVVVARRGVLATRHFKLVAYTVAVRIREAVAVAVIACIGIGAGSIFVCRISVVVARRGVLATRYFKLVAYTVAVRIR